MLATRTPTRDESDRVGTVGGAPVSVSWEWAPPTAADTPRPRAGGPDEPGLSLAERERRWACEWWAPD